MPIHSIAAVAFLWPIVSSEFLSRMKRKSIAIHPVPSPQRIESRIVEIRGLRVMLDGDLAQLYGVPTGALNQAVSRNIERFPTDFMFQISATEWNSLISQIVISKNRRGGRRTLPRVFTEQGVAMLSSVLRSERAIAVNIAVMRAFVHLRGLLTTHKELARKIDDMERRYEGKFAAVFDAIKQIDTKKKRPTLAGRPSS